MTGSRRNWARKPSPRRSVEQAYDDVTDAGHAQNRKGTGKLAVLTGYPGNWVDTRLTEAANLGYGLERPVARSQ